MQVDRRSFKPKNAKLGEKRRGVRHVTYFYNFGTPFISLEETKLEISNLVCRLTVGPSNQKNAKLGEKWLGVRHVTYFYNFGTPFISLEETKLETSKLVCTLIVEPSNQKMKK